jgi:Protein of unknown function (DUF3465)
MGWITAVLVVMALLAILRFLGRSKRRPSKQALRALQEKWSGSRSSSQRSTGSSSYHPQQSASANGYMTTLQGRVVSLKRDSHNPRTGTHEVFAIQTYGGRTVLVANNVEVGKRVSPQIGDLIEVRGQYLRASGLHYDDFIHNTHRSRSGRERGWIRYRGIQYD